MAVQLLTLTRQTQQDLYEMSGIEFTNLQIQIRHYLPFCRRPWWNVHTTAPYCVSSWDEGSMHKGSFRKDTFSASKITNNS